MRRASRWRADAPSSPGALADTLHITDDAYIQTDNSDKNKGSDEKIMLKEDGGDELLARGESDA